MWHQYFSRVLNIPSSYSQHAIEQLPTLPPDVEQDGPPSMEELNCALSKMKKGKAGGMTGILPELLLAGSAELRERMCKVMESVWDEREAVDDWKHAEIIGG